MDRRDDIKKLLSIFLSTCTERYIHFTGSCEQVNQVRITVKVCRFFTSWATVSVSRRNLIFLIHCSTLVTDMFWNIKSVSSKSFLYYLLSSALQFFRTHYKKESRDVWSNFNILKALLLESTFITYRHMQMDRSGGTINVLSRVIA
jgi:hypothetical protein